MHNTLFIILTMATVSLYGAYQPKPVYMTKDGAPQDPACVAPSMIILEQTPLECTMTKNQAARQKLRESARRCTHTAKKAVCDDCGAIKEALRLSSLVRSVRSCKQNCWDACIASCCEGCNSCLKEMVTELRALPGNCVSDLKCCRSSCRNECACGLAACRDACIKECCIPLQEKLLVLKEVAQACLRCVHATVKLPGACCRQYLQSCRHTIDHRDTCLSRNNFTDFFITMLPCTSSAGGSVFGCCITGSAGCCCLGCVITPLVCCAFERCLRH